MMADTSRPGSETGRSQVGNTVLVHVGLHKTGTTWLQRRLFQALDGQCIAYCGDIKFIYREFIVPEIGVFSADEARHAFSSLIETARANDRLPVISGEALAGRPFHAKFHRSVIAQRIAEVFPDAHILLTIREQVAIIHSMYGQYIRFGYTSDLRSFLRQPPRESSLSPVLDLDFYNYAKLIKGYRALFGEDRVTVMPFEKLIADPSGQIDMLSRRTGFRLSSDVPEETRTAVQNRGWSDLAYNAARQVNRFVSQDSRWQRARGRLSPNSIGHYVNRLTPGSLRKRMSDRARRLISDEIGPYYAASNREAYTLTGIDLGEIGYRVS